MKNIIFIGLRGSGKSTAGKALAASLQRPFLDTDSLVEKQAASSIASIVSTYGWEEFRARESKILTRVCSRKKQVIATGGGIVLKKSNQKTIATCTVFYLQAPLHILSDRLCQCPDPSRRPALFSGDPEKELATCLKEREHLYLSLADHVLNANQPVRFILDEIFHLCPEL